MTTQQDYARTERRTKTQPKALPHGMYGFQVVEFTKATDAKEGHDYYKVRLIAVNTDDKKTASAFDRFPDTEEFTWKLSSFMLSLGFPENETEVIWVEEEVKGREGYLLSVPSKGKDGREFTNYRYLRPDDSRLGDIPPAEEAPVESVAPATPPSTSAPAEAPANAAEASNGREPLEKPESATTNEILSRLKNAGLMSRA